jgi:hypothetical protein
MLQNFVFKGGFLVRLLYAFLFPASPLPYNLPLFMRPSVSWYPSPRRTLTYLCRLFNYTSPINLLLLWRRIDIRFYLDHVELTLVIIHFLSWIIQTWRLSGFLELEWLYRQLMQDSENKCGNKSSKCIQLLKQFFLEIKQHESVAISIFSCQFDGDN